MSYPQTGPLPAYYDILHVATNATTEEIRTAYKKESLRTHPDRQPNATPAQRKINTEKFQVVADAYYVLSDPTRRREYDILLRSRGKQRTSTSQNAGSSTAQGESPPGGFPFSTDPSASTAFFEQFQKYFTEAQAWANAGAGAGSTGGDGPARNTRSSTRQGRREKHHDADSEDEVEEDMGEGETEFDAESWNAGERPDADGVFGNVFDELLRPEVHRVAPWWTYLGSVSGATIGFILGNFPGALAGGLAGNRLGAIRDAKGKPVIQVFASLEGSQKAEILKALALKVFGSLSAM